MGFLDRLMGRVSDRGNAPAGADPDEAAIARYRYMLQTAPPETIEQAHAEAFAKLTPEQRRMVLEQLTATVPPSERAAARDDPHALARLATRAEIRQPGTMERVLGSGSRMGGPGFGTILAGSLLGTIAGSVVGGMIGQHFFGNDTAYAGGREQPDATAENTESDDDPSAAESDDGGWGDGGGDFGDV